LKEHIRLDQFTNDGANLADDFSGIGVTIVGVVKKCVDSHFQAFGCPGDFEPEIGPAALESGMNDGGIDGGDAIGEMLGECEAHGAVI
jgi:hypothetical protein